jgi:hypothetical protein
VNTLAIWSEPKSNYVAGDEVTPVIFNELAENEKYLKETQDTKITSVQVKDATINNTQHSTRTNLTASETLSVGFGKIRKWFADLKGLAFKDTVSNADIMNVDASKVTGLHNVATSGSYNDLIHKPEITKQAVGLGNVANERQYSSLNPPPYPVTSVNGLTGAVTIPPSEVNATGTYPNMTVGDSAKLEGKSSTEYITKVANEKILRRKDIWIGPQTTNGSLVDLFTSVDDLLDKEIEIEFSANGIITSTSSTGDLIRSAFANARHIVQGRFATGSTQIRKQLYSHDNSFQAFADIYFSYTTLTKIVKVGTIAASIDHNGAYANGGAFTRAYTGKVNSLTIYRVSIIKEDD